MNIEHDAAPGLIWSKSTYSAGDGGECVEIATIEHAVLVRDSKDTSLPHLTLTRTGWTHFVRHAARACAK
ncbi:DUF397 domain-containing protein [Streptomyces atratus]|uniref:DUF397 domain-containing protein n=1 Tax=Streptomyces atratus TaxID=1893 RepID=UPI00166FDCCB|nr:DUF397 domain-containing protein [Streptomyces atratus]WPW28147.1 DUF397 domain-containing protein [Streptomyces atratus]GGT28243.1 hypothetical protein GCM10010207_30210 [Streptomyces atratus]